MDRYKAVIFDLDDTLLDRDKAVDSMFALIYEKCYLRSPDIMLTAGIPGAPGKTDTSIPCEMLKFFKVHDNKGYSDKIKVLNILYDKYPPDCRIPDEQIIDFWNNNFPNCLSVDAGTFATIKAIAGKVKTAIVTNGAKKIQMAKIIKTRLNIIFETIIISGEIGINKPDLRIFELALHKLGVAPKDSLFVGDNLVNDVDGSQRAGMKGIWYNPKHIRNDTDIVPFMEIQNLGQILDLL